MDVMGLIPTSLDKISIFEPNFGSYKYSIEELQNASIANTQENNDILGKQGRKIGSLKTSKGATLSGTNGEVDTGLMGSNVGSEPEKKTVKYFYEENDVLGDTPTNTTSKYVAVGAIGSEIGVIRIYDGNTKRIKKVLNQGATVDEGVFTYDPATKEIEFSATDVSEGDAYSTGYWRNIEGTSVINESDKYSETVSAIVDVTATDQCKEKYHVQFLFPFAEFDGNFENQFGDGQTVQDFTLTSLADTCSKVGSRLWEAIIVEEDAPDVE